MTQGPPFDVNPFVASTISITESTIEHNTPADWRLVNVVTTDHCVMATWERDRGSEALTVRPDDPVREWGIDTRHRVEYACGSAVAEIGDAGAFERDESAILAALRVLYRQSDATDETAGPQPVDPATPPANESVRLITGITRTLHTPEVITSHTSGSGRTIRVGAHQGSLRTDRQLDASAIFAGDTETRERRYFRLYTPLDFIRAERANYGPGAQAGVTDLTEWADLPAATHRPAPGAQAVADGGDRGDGDDDSLDVRVV